MGFRQTHYHGTPLKDDFFGKLGAFFSKILNSGAFSPNVPLDCSRKIHNFALLRRDEKTDDRKKPIHFRAFRGALNERDTYFHSEVM